MSKKDKAEKQSRKVNIDFAGKLIPTQSLLPFRIVLHGKKCVWESESASWAGRLIEKQIKAQKEKETVSLGNAEKWYRRGGRAGDACKTEKKEKRLKSKKKQRRWPNLIYQQEGRENELAKGWKG